MPTIKDLLKTPLSLPRSIEASLPTGAPQVSAIMGSIIASLPEGPQVPIPIPAQVAIPQVPQITEFIKSIGASLPAGLPQIPGTAASATPPAPARAPELIFE